MTAMIMATPATAPTAPSAVVRVLFVEDDVEDDVSSFVPVPVPVPVTATEVVPVREAGDVDAAPVPPEVVWAVFCAGTAAVNPFDVQ